MLRVGLTGELGSGKSTVARMLAERGAVVFSSDEMARAMMQPGHSVYAQIVARFGPAIVRNDGALDRSALARLAFDPAHPRVEELNAIVHPAVIAEQALRLAELARTQPHAIVVVESALIFSTRHASANWRDRFDCIVLVTAPDEAKMDRFVARVAAGRSLSSAETSALRADAQQRLDAQRTPAASDRSFLIINNAGDVEELESKVEALWTQLVSIERSAKTRPV